MKVTFKADIRYTVTVRLGTGVLRIVTWRMLGKSPSSRMSKHLRKVWNPTTTSLMTLGV